MKDTGSEGSRVRKAMINEKLIIKNYKRSSIFNSTFLILNSTQRMKNYTLYAIRYTLIPLECC